MALGEGVGTGEHDLPAMGTRGLDMSTKARKTAAVRLEWSPRRALVTDVVWPLRLTDIAPLIIEHADEWWAVDVPFGWPDAFEAMIRERHSRPLSEGSVPAESEWDKWRTDTVARRVTDHFLLSAEGIRQRPLPASFDKLGATAAAWVLIEARLHQRGVSVDRSGVTGRIVETYPRAALNAWSDRNPGKIGLDGLQELFPFLDTSRHVAAMANDDVRDAVICAVVARARALDLTILPPDEDLPAARREGWIHVTREKTALA